MKIRVLFFAIISIVLIFVSCNGRILQNGKENIIGVKIYEYKGNYLKLFNTWKNAGINTVFASTELLSNNEFKDLAKINGIYTFVIIPIFYSPEDLEKDSTLFAINQYGERAEQEWVKFICPSAEEYKKSRIVFISKFIQEHHPTGISLDFIRHFAYWEKVYSDAEFDSLPNSCFDKRCITKFLSAKELILPNDKMTELEIYEWIKQNNFENWVEWKCGLVTDFVKKVVAEVKGVDQNIKVNLHAVPWRANDFDGAIRKVAGQDFKALSKYVDYISPMTYSHMVKQKPEWIHSVVKDIKKVSGADILPSIQVGIAYLNDTLLVSEFEQCLNEALKEPSSGVVLWNWSALDNDYGKYEVVRRIINN